MKICSLCQEQMKKSSSRKPHKDLLKMDECRIFIGRNPSGHEEQDYQCTACQSRFTHSTDKNDLGWTLWQG